MRRLLQMIFPFLHWPRPTGPSIRADLIAGVSVALILVPQSMAYAQLAGLPPVVGLYASLLPVIIAALWGSSNQLATGPVAVVSLLTAAALMPYAALESEEFVALALILAFIVGAFQLSLGVFRLGAIVSFISHPVIVGFSSAAAIIIGLSQLNKILGLSIDTSGHFLVGVMRMLGDIGQAHLPTVIFGVGAIALMVVLKKFVPKIPGVLIAVVLATLISWAVGFEKKAEASLNQIDSGEIARVFERINLLTLEVEELEEMQRRLEARALDASGAEAADLSFQADLVALDLDRARAALSEQKRAARAVQLRRIGDGESAVFRPREVAEDDAHDGVVWRFSSYDGETVRLNGGGSVVGTIPRGLPSLSMPSFDYRTWLSIATAALIIALVGFTEAIAIAKAMAAKTGQRLDPNQELIGQGLANLSASFSQGYPVSGSFSRSAVNLASGAVSGLSSVFTALIVVIVLLFLTPLLYHLPQAVLAAIIMMAVFSLINFGAMKHAWIASRHDGAASVVTFIATLAVAPNLEIGVLIGAGLAIVLFLYRSMRPRVAELARFEDGTLREAKRYGLKCNEKVGLLRFDGPLFFANVSYFEDAVLNLAARHPDAEYIIIVTKGINEMDASGEEAVANLARRLKQRGVTLVFAGVKAQVLDVMQKTGLYERLGGDENVFRSTDGAISTIEKRLNTRVI
ncbi:MAG: SulP family inorganic anion transporter [Thioalkalivibrionaceae bacterium]